MSQYLLSVHTVEDEAPEPMTEEDQQRSVEEMDKLNGEIRAAGAWVFGGALHAPSRAAVVRGYGGEVLTTDGPFAEAKEHLGGFYILDVADLEAAIDWAAKTSALVGKPIEVRPFMSAET